MEIYLEPTTIDALSEHLETKQSCIGLIIGKPISDCQIVIQDLLPLNLRPTIYQTHTLSKLVLKRQELEQFAQNIEMLQPQGLKIIGIWTYSQTPQSQSLEVEYMTLCQQLFYVDLENPPSHSFAIVNFQYDQKAGFHITAHHSPSFDVIEKSKLTIGEIPAPFQLRRISSLVKFSHSLKPKTTMKVDSVFQILRKELKAHLEEETCFFLEGQALESESSVLQLSSQRELRVEAFQKQTTKGIEQLEVDSMLSLQWSGSYPVEMYIEGAADLTTVRRQLIERVLQQFDEALECARQSQGQPNAFQMDSDIIARVDYFNLYIPRTVHFQVGSTLFKDFLLPSEKEQSAQQRLCKLFGRVKLVEKGEQKGEQKGEEKGNEQVKTEKKEVQRKQNWFYNKGVLIGVGVGLLIGLVQLSDFF